MEHDDKNRQPGANESAPDAISARLASVTDKLAETAACCAGPLMRARHLPASWHWWPVLKM
jgi:hypothetical protein